MEQNKLEARLPELVAAIVDRMGHKFKFGPYEVEDLKQEAFIWASEALPKYDGRTTLRAFMYHVIYTRCCNLKRKHYERRATPCERCPLAAYHKDTDTCLAYQDREDCEYWASWLLRNEQKKSLNLTFSAGSPQSRGATPFELAHDKDLLDFLEEKVDDLRGLQIVMRGGHLSEPRLTELFANIRELLCLGVSGHEK